MDSQLDIAGAFVLKKVKRKPGRKVAAQNLETTTSLQKEEAKKNKKKNYFLCKRTW